MISAFTLTFLACTGGVSRTVDLDADGDGVEIPYDCDDEDPDVHPDADERCDGRDDDCDFETDEDAVDGALWYPDQDDDGWGLGEYPRLACAPDEGEVGLPGDCDDHDPDISPDAEERCDGDDDDCDGQIDEDAADADDWYPDADGDGDGAPGAPWVSCEAPDGYVGDDDDCDDSDPAVYRHAPEVCDGVDDDCDGQIDEDAIGGATWWRDQDGDGYGDPSHALWACEQPETYIDNSDDCDDDDPDTWPGATEVCDGADNDCDGQVDDDAVDAPSWQPDTDADGYGDPSSPYTRQACALPEGYAEEATDCDDGDPDVWPGATERCGSGVDEDCDGVLDDCERTVVLRGESAVDLLGYAVSAAGDVDGDGVPDALVGAYGSGKEGAGEVYALRGPLSAEASPDDAWATWTGEAADLAGKALDGGGDLDGDGVGELLVGAACSDRHGVDAGAAWLVAAEPGGGALDDGLARIFGEAGDQLGAAVSLGIDPEGSGAILVGAPEDDDGGTDAGQALLFLDPGGLLRASSADATLLGVDDDDQAGEAVDWGADLDGDGVGDLVVGASRAEAEGARHAGSVYITLGPVLGSMVLSDADLRLDGSAAGQRAGHAVLTPGDLDGDGQEDLVVSAPYATGEVSSSGTIYAVFGTPRSGALADAAGATVLGDSANARAGWSLGAGDLNGDGVLDLAVGAPYDGEPGVESGAAWLVLGPLSGELPLSLADARIGAEEAGDQLGRALAVPGDLDGDGRDDLLIGAPQDSVGADRAGALLLMPGW